MEFTEKVLETELVGWVQRMENALAQLKAEEEKGEESGGDKSQTKNEGTPAIATDPIPAKVNTLILLDMKVPSRPDVLIPPIQ